jgi:hypothetical protein
VVWRFVAPESPTVVFTSARVRAPLEQEITEQVGVFRPLGRGKAVVVSGSLYGVDGRYEITTIGETEWASLEALVKYQGTVLVQDPLGRQKYVRFINRKWTEVGLLGNLNRQVKIDYVEVSAP